MRTNFILNHSFPQTIQNTEKKNEKQIAAPTNIENIAIQTLKRLNMDSALDDYQMDDDDEIKNLMNVKNKESQPLKNRNRISPDVSKLPDITNIPSRPKKRAFHQVTGECVSPSNKKLKDIHPPLHTH
jgi:hypothetical protein